jgi:hypothetical protein
MSQPAGLPRHMGMLTWFIKNRLAAFEKTFGYDLSYARELLEVDRSAFLTFARVQKLGAYRKDVPLAVHYAAKMVGTMAEDCGPCAQLIVTMALRDGVDPKLVSAIVRRDDEALPEDVWLGVAFARATLARDPAADALRETIIAKWGQRALISIAFGLTVSRVYPTIKYALGHGKACQRIVVEGAPIVVARSAA